MAYIIGLLSRHEEETLRQRGWELEDPPAELIPEEYNKETSACKMAFVDASMFQVMSGPDWDTEKMDEQATKKPSSFVITVPLKGFSKHDDPKEIAEILTELVQRSLRKWEVLAGTVPFDIKNTTTEIHRDGSG